MAAERGEERVLVCVGSAPGSARLIHAGARLARSLGCAWIAANVALPQAVGDEDRNRISDHLRLAESLGADAVRLSGRDAAEALTRYATARGVTRILVGKPMHPRWRDGWSAGMVERLIRSSGDVDVHVITGVPEPPASRTPSRPAIRPRWPHILGAVAMVLAVSVLAKVAAPILSDADVVMGYLLVVLVAAYRYGTTPALVASAASVAGYNFFFVPPFHTFAVADTRNLLTFTVLFGVGFAASTLSDRLRRQEGEAVAREARTAALLSLTRALAAATDQAEVASAMVGEAVARLARGAVLLSASEGGLTLLASAGEASTASLVAALAGDVQRSRAIAVRGELRAIPVLALGEVVGVLVLVGTADAVDDLADAFARQGGLAIARARDAQLALQAGVQIREEQLRSALLSSVSHDLRTPLAAITLAATTLLDSHDHLSEPQRRELLTSARDEAERLERLVASLLEMTRLSSGSMVVHREWVPIEEIVGGAFARLERLTAGRPITTNLDPDLPLVAVDPILAELLLVNLVDNAVRHTPPGTAIEFHATCTAGTVTLTVRDHGGGLPTGNPDRLFEPFVRGAIARSAGSGLGLAICRGIARAHGGDVVARSPEGGGAAFVITLPTGGSPPPVPADPPEAP